MAPIVLASLLLLSPQQSDTATFHDAATAELFARARVRHIAQDTQVQNYRATVRTRMDASAGRSRFARQTALFAHESVAEVSWQTPNDLKVRVLGTRARLPIIRAVFALSIGSTSASRSAICSQDSFRLSATKSSRMLIS